MQDIRLKTKKREGYVEVLSDALWICFSDDEATYKLDFSHYEKLASYKSLPALEKYVKANQKLDLTDRTRKFADLSELEKNAIVAKINSECPALATALPSPNTSLDLPSEFGEVEGNPSYVANPTSSDTPFKTELSPLFVEVDTIGEDYPDEVVAIAIVDINEDMVFKARFKPSRPITKFAEKYYGITNAQVAKCESFAKLWKRIQKAIKGHTLVMYNADFDKAVLRNTINIAFTGSHRGHVFHQLVPNDTQCLMTLYARYWGEYSDYHQDYTYQSLDKACRQQKIKTDDLQGKNIFNDRCFRSAVKQARLYKHLRSKGVITSPVLG